MPGDRVHGKFDDLGRFADPSVLILTSLSGGPKHGYAIMTDVAAFSEVSMEPGTLYGALSRLEKRGWIRPLDTDERRRPSEITAAGQREDRAGTGLVLVEDIEHLLAVALLPAGRIAGDQSTG